MIVESRRSRTDLEYSSARRLCVLIVRFILCGWWNGATDVMCVHRSGKSESERLRIYESASENASCIPFRDR